MTKNWEQEKSRLYNLYMEQRMRLTSVREIMAQEHGFTASERAYKQRFKDWGWCKKTPRNQGARVNGAAAQKFIRSPPMEDHHSDSSRQGTVETSPHQQYRAHRQSPSSGVNRGIQPHMEPYHDYSMTFDPHPYQAVSAAEMEVYAAPSHPHPHMGLPTITPTVPTVPSGIQLGNYGRGVGPSISLPPVSALQRVNWHRQNINEILEQAQRGMDVHRLDQVEACLENALTAVRWLRQNGHQ